MALVNYSGSESSGDEARSPVRQPTKAKTASAKPAFHKVVDSSNPHKIRVSLPEPSKPDIDEDLLEPPSKKAKTGPGAFGGFNALLPAPKRSIAPNGASSAAGRGHGNLESRMSLKTGATPGFSRENESASGEAQPVDANNNSDTIDGRRESYDTLHSDSSEKVPLPSGLNITNSEPQLKGRPTMFKPLSVARKPQKRKPLDQNGSAVPKGDKSASSPRNDAPQKSSLFSIGEKQEMLVDDPSLKKPYQPVVYQNDAAESKPSTEDAQPTLSSQTGSHDTLRFDSGVSNSQSLDAIASDLNLSASAKRQLLGRQHNNASAINVVNFNTDQEYKANEAVRRSGEQVQHNPVRSIAPGKHSLKQLVNMGTSQADALEESFASGRRNRNEAGSKYGW